MYHFSNQNMKSSARVMTRAAVQRPFSPLVYGQAIRHHGGFDVDAM
jgi:hypothetical protein